MKPLHVPALALLLAAGLTAVACGGDKAAAPAPAKSATQSAAAAPAALDPKDVAEATQIFATRCFTCHGAGGKGDGPGSAGLTPKPRDLTSPEWQASVTDEHIEKIILYGGAAVGLSPMMPPNPDFMSKPGLVRALRAHVRGLAPAH